MNTQNHLCCQLREPFVLLDSADWAWTTTIKTPACAVTAHLALGCALLPFTITYSHSFLDFNAPAAATLFFFTRPHYYRVVFRSLEQRISR